MKKLTALLLAVLMVVSVSVSAMASTPPTGTITINNANLNTTYQIYRVFDLETEAGYNGSSEPSAYFYTLNQKWQGLLTYTGTGTEPAYKTYITIDETDGHITWNEGADAKAFASMLCDYLASLDTSSAIGTDYTATTDNATRVATVTGVTLGYYLIRSDSGSLCALDTTNPTATINNKNSRPFIEKYVKEDSLESTEDTEAGWGATNDADINDTVTFRIVVGIDAGDTDTASGEYDHQYTVHDTLPAGLTFVSIENVKVTPSEGATVTLGTDSTSTDAAGGRYYELKTDGLSNNETFNIQLHAVKTNDTVQIEYTATLNSNANVGVTGNQNTATLYYKTASDAEATAVEPSASTMTYTWELPIYKYTNKNNTETPLAGAKFVLLNEGLTKMATISDGKITGWTNVPDNSSGTDVTWPDANTLTTGVDGKVSVKGLDADTYFLKEIEAPAGYNMLKQPLKVEITSAVADTGTTRTVSYAEYKAPESGTGYNDNSESFNGDLRVLNNTGTELPATGGIGTTLFYVLGAVLVLGVAVVFTVRRRMSVEG